MRASDHLVPPKGCTTMLVLPQVAGKWLKSTLLHPAEGESLKRHLRSAPRAISEPKRPGERIEKHENWINKTVDENG